MKTFRSIIAGVVISMTASFAVAQAAYKIESAWTGKVLDVTGGSTENGATLQQWEYTGAPWQQWTLEAVGDGTSVIRSVWSGKVLDVTDASNENGAIIQQWDYSGVGQQRWILEDVGGGLVAIKSVQSGKALDVYMSYQDNGTFIQQWDYNAVPWQQWRLVPANGNMPPVPSVSIEGHGNGDSVSNPASITVHYSATDSDGNLSGIRYNIWNSTTGYFDNGGGGFVAQSGASGDIVKTFTLDAVGVWYVWTDAQDASGSYVSTGDWDSGLRITVKAPVVLPTCDSITTSANPVTVSSYQVYAYNVQNASSVRFPTWTQARGPNTARWYKGVYNAAYNRWECTVNAGDHAYESGTFLTDTYATGSDGQEYNLGRISVAVNIPMGYITIPTAASATNGDIYSQISFEINDLNFNGIVRDSVRYNSQTIGFAKTTYAISRIGVGQGYVAWQLVEQSFNSVTGGAGYTKSLNIARYRRMENKWEVSRIVADTADNLHYMSVLDIAYSMYPQQIDWTYLVQQWDYNAPRKSGTFTVPKQALQ